MKVAIIGAGGEIGYYIYVHLKSNGFDVVPIVRSSLGPLLSRFDIRPCIFDEIEKHSLRDTLNGCDAIVNCMLFKKESGGKQGIVKKNYEYCKRLLSAASETAVEKVVHLSSIVVLPPRITDDDLQSSHHISVERDWYTLTKIKTEKLFADWPRHRMSTVILRPGIVYGACMNWSRVAFDRTSRHTVVLPDVENRCYAVHPVDIARLIVAILEKDKGEFPRMLYAINPEKVDWSKFYSTHAERAGLKNRVASVPLTRLISLEKKEIDSPIRRMMGLAYDSQILDVPKRYAMREILEFIESRYGDVFRAPNAGNKEIGYATQLLPSPPDLMMYQSSGDVTKVEHGQSLGFRYCVSLEKGSDNAGSWWRGEVGE